MISRSSLASVFALLFACGGSPEPTATPRPPAAPTALAESPRAVVVEVPRVAPTAVPTVGAAPEGPSQPVASGEGWPMFQGNAARSGFAPRPTIEKPRILWKAKVGVQSWLNAPVITEGTVVVPSSGATHNKADPMDGVYGIDLATGKQKFFVHTDQDANGVAALGDRVFATSDDGHLYAIDLAGPKVAWKKRGAGKMYTHPLVVRAGDKSLVVVGDSTGSVRAYDAQSGADAWRVQLNGAVRGGISSDGVSLFAASQKGDVMALTPNGKTIWNVRGSRPGFSGGAPVPMEIYAAPTIASGMVIVPFARDTYYDVPALVAFDVQSGKEKWRATGDGSNHFGNVRSSVALAGDKLLYSEPYSGDVVALRVADGKLAYRVTVGPCYFPQWASPVVVGATAYVPRFDGSVYAIQASTGKTSWQMYLGDASSAGRGSAPGGSCDWDVASGSPIYSSLAIAGNGTIVAGTGEGFVFAIGK